MSTFQTKFTHAIDRKLRRLLAATASVGLAVALIGSAHPASADTAAVPVQLTVNNTANVYDAPSTNADYVGQVLAGQNWFAYGVDTTGKWIEIEITPGTNDWTAASAFNFGGLTLPVVAGVTGDPVNGTTAVATAAPAVVAPVATAAAPVAAAPVAASSTVATVPFLAGINTTTNLYDATSASSDVIGQLQQGQTWFVLGTDSTGKWVLVQITPGMNGWAPISAFTLYGQTLPVTG